MQIIEKIRNQLKIGQKITVGFACVIILSLITVFWASMKIAHLTTKIKTYHENSFVINQKLNSIKELLMKNQLAIYEILSIVSISEQNRTLESIYKNFKQIDLIFLSVNQKENKKIKKIVGIGFINDYKKWNRQVKQFILTYKEAQANKKTISKKKTKDIQSELKILLHQLNFLQKSVNKENEKFYHQSLMCKNRSFQIIVIFLALILISGIAIALLITQSIKKPMDSVIFALNNVAQGNLNQKLTINRKDEFGKLADAFMNMQNKLNIEAQKNIEKDHARDWIKTGINRLFMAMRGNQKLDELSDKVLTFLTKYIHANVGVLYLYDAQKNLLELKASYSLINCERLNKYIYPDEGLISQALKEQRVIIVEEIDQEYFKNGSLLTEVTPKNIIIVPFYYQNKPIGVIELGTIQTIQKQVRQFFDSITENLAISFNTIQLKNNID